jgi:hypothetical protein
MISNILDTIIAQADIEGWVIKYVALSPAYMKSLISEAASVFGKEFEADSIVKYKETSIKTKDIVGFQVAYELPI